MKPLYILIAGTLSLFLAIGHFFFPAIAWSFVLLPVASPMIFAYVAFVTVIIHALGTGKLEIVPPAVDAEKKADAAAQTT